MTIDRSEDCLCVWEGAIGGRTSSLSVDGGGGGGGGGGAREGEIAAVQPPAIDRLLHKGRGKWFDAAGTD